MLTIVFVLPFQMRTEAAKGIVPGTENREATLPNYDIRTDKQARDKVVGFRSSLGKDASQVADIRDAMVRGETALRQRVPTLKIEYNLDIRIPEVIAPEVKFGRTFLTRPSSAKRSDILKTFLDENAELVGARSSQIDDLKVFADYTNPDGNLSFVELNQEINGIPVFRGEVKAGFTKRGEMIRVINNFAPGLDHSSLSTDFGDPLAAVKAAARSVHSDGANLDLRKNADASNELKTVFGTGDWATTAEKMYFPTEPGVAVPSWRVLISNPNNAYYIIVDAQAGTLLWRKDLTDDQTQAANYGVYVNPNSMINVAHNPFPFSPGPLSPNGMQGAAIQRVTITRVGNEPPYQFNNNGWITNNRIQTDGNNVQAGLDRDGVDGIDQTSEAFSQNRNFVYTYSPLDPNTDTGEDPVPATQTYPGSQFQQGSVTQLFYICNRFHDEAYLLGFTEQARNFQNDNFGRGGAAFDRVSAEGQDSTSINNANFMTPADGGRGKMQMYLWPSTNPDIDGNLDADVVVHEHTHGLSNRLHGNASGLTLSMSRGIGEGSSDFFALSMLSQASDPINGIYTMSAYDTIGFLNVGTNNNYYGIRRFPYAVRAFVGPNGRPHDPRTFADIDATHLDLSDGAYSPRSNSSSPDEVHNLGEVWCGALWEMRARMVTRLGWELGNRKALQLVTNGMKLAPLGPTFLTERDAILAAAQAEEDPSEAAADVADIWAGFAIRGIGAGASIQNVGSGFSDTRVTEAFDLPNLYQSPDITISDQGGNGNGFPEAGELLSITVPLTNETGLTASNVTLDLVGGGSASYGTIENVQTAARDISFTVPAETPCGTVVSITLSVNSSLGPVSFTRTFVVGVPQATFSENFDGVTAPAIPSGWTVVAESGGTNFVTTSDGPDTPPNSAFARDPASIGGATNLISPEISINTPAATVTFRNKYDTEPGWDGGVLEISIANGPWQDILVAGGTFLQNGYNRNLGPNGPNNPLAGRNAWSGDSGGYLTTIARLPAAASGNPVHLRWRFGADSNTAATGWFVDSIQVAGSYNCGTAATGSTLFDYDADGKSDISIFRPSVGAWYLQQSTAGLAGMEFGYGTDKIAPADYDGDGKTDVAVYRPETGIWYVVNSSNGTVSYFNFGIAEDLPTPADYDGDGIADYSVFRPSTGTWYRHNSSDGSFFGQQFGANGDHPTIGDFDGDGKADVAVFRPNGGAWYQIFSSDGSFHGEQFGIETDLITPADFDGDGKTDLAVFRPSNGFWYTRNSNGSVYTAFPFGLSTDIPAAGDFDGDGKADLSVFRPSDGTWYRQNSRDGSFFAFQFGTNGDKPTQSAFRF